MHNTYSKRARATVLITLTARAVTTAAAVTVAATFLLLHAPHAGAADQNKPSALHTPVTEFTQATQIAPPMNLSVGKSTLLRVHENLTRISVGNPETADVILINPREVYLLGKHAGTTNIFMWEKSGKTTVMDLTVSVDASVLKEKLNRLMPTEKDVVVEAAGDSLILSGPMTDAVKVQRAMLIAEQLGGKKVLNLMHTGSVPQVMLEVKIAEVSKSLIDRLGAEFNAKSTDSFSFSILASTLFQASNSVTLAKGKSSVTVEAERKNALVKILAEPTIMAISGQEGAFFAGGKIFIPVPQTGATGTTITLEEKEFGVGLKFAPTVLEGGLINLRVSPEASELAQVGTTINANGVQSVLPTITTRRASTTVQLMDGQSFAIGGLIKNNVSETTKAFPLLGELPVLGALFRSSDFQNERTELLFIVTPRLVKPLEQSTALPTDSFIAPSRAEFFLNGQLEGSPSSAPAPVKSNGAKAGTAGFEVK